MASRKRSFRPSSQIYTFIRLTVRRGRWVALLNCCPSNTHPLSAMLLCVLRLCRHDSCAWSHYRSLTGRTAETWMDWRCAIHQSSGQLEL